MFLFCGSEILFQIPRNILWCTRLYNIISRKTVLMFTASCVWNLLGVIFIPNKSYCISTVWNFRIIINFSIFSPDMIILFFWNNYNIPTKHCFNESAQFLTFSDSLFIFLCINNLDFFIHTLIIIQKNLEVCLKQMFCIVQ